MPTRWVCWISLSAGIFGGCGPSVGPSDPGRLPGRGAAGPRAPAAASPERPLVRRARAPRLVRLSHSQYENTLVDLFGLTPAELGVPLAPDARSGFEFTTSSALGVDGRLGPQYRAVAEALGERVATRPELFERLVPCREAEPACRDAVLRGLGLRALRRPLPAEPLRALSALFEAEREQARARGADAEHAFAEALGLAVEALLQTPDFLYQRVPEPEGPSPERDYDIASRLSYFLYDSMPDDELFEAAAASELHTNAQIEAAATRMLQSSRVLSKLVSFHEQAFEMHRFDRASPDLSVFPAVPPAFAPRLRHSAKLFVRDVLQSGGGLEELLTAPYAYVDEGLAPLYGVDAPAPGRFARVDLTETGRRGWLMQLGYLASNAYSVRTDPIHRGLFVIRGLLCRQIGDPPPGSTERPPPPTTRPIVTTRDEVSLVTGQSFCPSCHREINPPGYAFEAFDAVGRAREMDNGAPVDTRATLRLDGRAVSVSGASELVEQLAQSREAHRCYARRFMEFAYGRPLARSDEPTLARIAARSLPIADILLQIITSRAFLGLEPIESAARVAEVTP